MVYTEKHVAYTISSTLLFCIMKHHNFTEKFVSNIYQIGNYVVSHLNLNLTLTL